MAEREISGRINFEGQAAEEVERLNEQMNESVETLSELETESEIAGATVENAGMEGADSMENLAQETDTASESMQDATGAAEGFGGAIGALGVVAATAGIVAFGKSSIDAAVSLEEQRFRVEALSGDAFPGLKAAIDRTIVSQKGLRAEGDLSEAVNEALKLGVSADVVAASLENVAQIGSVVGFELPRAMKAIGLAIETGTESQLERLGFGVEEALGQFDFAVGKTLNSLTKMQRETVILAAIQNRANKETGAFGDFLETSAAQLQIFDTQIGNVMEIIGGVFLPVMNAILKPISAFILFLQENEEALLAFEIAVGVVAAVVGVLLVGALFAAIPPAFAFAGAMLAAAAVPLAITAGIVILILIIDDLIAIFTGGESVIGDFVDFTIEKFGELMDFIAPFTDIIGNIFGIASGGKGPSVVLNDAEANIVELLQGDNIREAPGLDVGLDGGGGGVGGTQIGALNFDISIKAPEGRFGTKDAIESQVTEALDSISRGRLREQLGITS